MIRDPSDGSVKPEPVIHASDCALHNGPALPVGKCDCGFNRPTSADNWGLTSLTQKPKASTFKAMDGEELKQHYSEYGLRFVKKERSE